MGLILWGLKAKYLALHKNKLQIVEANMFDFRLFCVVITISIGFLALGNAQSAQCDSFTVGGCIPNPDTPTGVPIAGVDERACQAYCNTTLGCLFYTYEKEHQGSTYCTLFTEDYRQNCGLYGANMDTDLTTCIQKQGITNTCDEFINQDCDYSSAGIALEAEPGTIADPSHCQELCGIFMDSLGCRYWVFQDENHTDDHSTRCTLYKSADNIVDSCNAYHGPKSPFHSECGTYQ